MNVEGEYEYYAINIKDDSIKNGYEPEFEEAKIIAESFEKFIELIISGKLRL
jgi:hypothetical protein